MAVEAAVASSNVRQARFIPREELGQVQVARWRFGGVNDEGGFSAGYAEGSEPPEVAILRGQQAAREEGFANGFAEGQAQANQAADLRMDEYIHGEGRQAAQRLAEVIVSSEKALADSKQDIAKGILELACELARQIVRREVEVNADALMPVIRESVELLAADGKPVTLRLNPVDATLLEKSVSDEFAGLQINIVADKNVEEAGCLVETADGSVDGSLAKRWSRAIATLGMTLPWSEEASDESNAAEPSGDVK